MATFNDAFLGFLVEEGASSSNFQDAQMEFLISQGITRDGTLSDMWDEWFTTSKGYTEGTLTDKWYAYLGALGYDGSLNDRWLMYARVYQFLGSQFITSAGDTFITSDGDNLIVVAP